MNSESELEHEGFKKLGAGQKRSRPATLGYSLNRLSLSLCSLSQIYCSLEARTVRDSLTNRRGYFRSTVKETPRDEIPETNGIPKKTLEKGRDFL